jgi:hypothetical protein
VQTTKTNGRVNRLEADSEDMRSDVDILMEARSESKGRLKVLWALAIAVATILGYLLDHLIEKIIH